MAENNHWIAVRVQQFWILEPPANGSSGWFVASASIGFDLEYSWADEFSLPK